jgi:hypothetical protein
MHVHDSSICKTDALHLQSSSSTSTSVLDSSKEESYIAPIVGFQLAAVQEEKQKKSKKPTKEEIHEYITIQGLTANDADWLYDKWEGNGHKNNGKPIADWQATIRSWKRSGTIFPSQKPQQHSKPNGHHKGIEEQIPLRRL